VPASAFAAAILVAGVAAALGNVVVYVSLCRRGVPVKFFWSGTPFYLYGLCVRAAPPVAPWLRRLALATNVVFILASISLLLFFAIFDPPTSNNRWRGP
jgi:hypothetical protein